jgi:hypothetical protein
VNQKALAHGGVGAVAPKIILMKIKINKFPKDGK